MWESRPSAGRQHQQDTAGMGGQDGPPPAQRSTQEFNDEMRDIYNAVETTGMYNFQGARRRVPSGLNIQAWEQHLQGYGDNNLVDFLAYGWPVNFRREHILVPTASNHPSAEGYSEHIDFYVETEIRHKALMGPYRDPPIQGLHTSPLMTKPKKDSDNRRVIMDLSWPAGGGRSMMAFLQNAT